MNFFLATIYRIPVGSLFVGTRSWLRRLFKLYLPEDMIVDDVMGYLEPHEIQWFEQASLEDLYSLHHTYGMDIRNTYGMWDVANPYTSVVSPTIDQGIITDASFPDNISFRIIQKICATVKANQSLGE